METARKLAAHALKHAVAADFVPAGSESSSSSSSDGDPLPLGEPKGKAAYEIPLAVLILILYIVLGHGLELWTNHQQADAAAKSFLMPITRQRQPRALLCTFHESGPAILLGLAVGLMMNYGGGQQFDFNADIFFYVVLPPIIFHQGYAFKKRNFFRYFHYIFSFGILGTVIQFVAITLLAFYVSSLKALDIVRDDGVPIGLSLHECMLIASVFSAADEVATLSLIKQSEYPKLSAVLFGEGVMNDAISILLFHAVTNVNVPGTVELGPGMAALHLLFQVVYLLITAASVGLGSGLLVSALLKSLPSLQTNAVRQTAILILGGYFSFSISEALELSGVLAVFFCGLTLSHYAWHSLGVEAQTASKITSDTISMVAEAYCFAAIGLSVHEFDASQWCVGFIMAMVVVLMIARALAIYGICFFGSLVMPKTFKLPLAEQNVLFFGGLVRGAISWAQVVQVRDAHRGVMVTTTLGVILFTVVIFGAAMPFFTRHLTPEDEPGAERKRISSVGSERGGGGGGSGALTTFEDMQQAASKMHVLPPRHGSLPYNSLNGTAAGAQSQRSRTSTETDEEKRERGIVTDASDTPKSPETALLLGAQGGRKVSASSSSPSQQSAAAAAAAPRTVVTGSSGEAAAVAGIVPSGTPAWGQSMWAWFDNTYMKPLFGGRVYTAEDAAAEARRKANNPLGVRTRTYSGMANYGSVLRRQQG